MNEITSIIDLQRTADSIINDLKEKSISVPCWSDLINDYEPTKHRIVSDHTTRKDKVKKDGSVEIASRIYLGLEKLLTNRMNEFTFSIPVKRIYHNTDNNKVRKQIANAIEYIYKHSRIDSVNLRRGLNYFASCEVATVWYTVESKNSLYGFESKYKMKCKTYSPMDGVNLYPLIDELGDMLAMSFEYTTKSGDKNITYFDTYTDTNRYQWRNEGANWELVKSEEIIIKKIPSVYIYRPVPIYHGLSYIRNEIEYTLSRNSDVIAYNSSPILMVSGSLQGSEDKGESRRVYRVENGGSVSYVSWSQSIEALKYHVDTLTKMFWSQAQIPDISFEKMAALGNIGFDARQTLLTDSHLKVGDESGAWIEVLERECNVIKSFLKELNKEWESEIDNVEVEHIITPFIQNDENATVDRIIKMNGGKPVISQLDSIQMAGYSSNPDATLAQIQKEDSESSANNMNNLFGEGSE